MPKGTKILMVDDDKMLIDMYKERLELAGYQVEISRDGEEGLAKVHQVKPDIVLLDIMMPKVNGYEALASMKSDPATKDIPVIILSALMRDINKSKAVESGADDYIIKSEAMPVDVIKKVEVVLKKYHKDIPPATATPTSATAPSAEPKEPSITEAAKKPAEGPKPVTPEIEFQPQVAVPEVATSTPPPAPTAVPDAIPTAAAEAMPTPPASPAPTVPMATGEPATPSKTSPVVVFFLVLIVILIVASDIFFYMQYMLSK